MQTRNRRGPVVNGRRITPAGVAMLACMGVAVFMAVQIAMDTKAPLWQVVLRFGVGVAIGAWLLVIIFERGRGKWLFAAFEIDISATAAVGLAFGAGLVWLPHCLPRTR